MRKIFLFLLLLTACDKKIDISLNNNGVVSTNQVNGTLQAGGSVSNLFKATPNQEKIVYIADEDGNGTDDLYVYDVASNSRTQLTTVPLGRDVKNFIISPNSLKIVFLADYNTSGLDDLFAINIDGSSRVQLNAGVDQAGRRVAANCVDKTCYKVSDDSMSVVFITNELTGIDNLFINKIAGADLKRLNVPTGPVLSFELASTLVVYKITNTAGIVTNPVLRESNMTATMDQQISQAYPNPAQDRGIIDFVVSPDKSKVLFWGNPESGIVTELYTSSLSTPVQVKVTNIQSSNASGGISSASFNKAGTKALYLADQDTDDAVELYQSDIGGSFTKVKVNMSLIAGESISDFKLSPDGSKVSYRKESTSGILDLFLTDLTGLSSFKINSPTSPLIGQESVGEYQFTSTGISYFMDKGHFNTFNVFSNNLVGSNERLVSDQSVVGGFYDPSNLNNSQLDILNSKVIYMGTVNGIDTGIYSSAGTPRKINSQGDVIYNSTNKPFITLTTGRVVYIENNGTTNNLMISTIP